ncbi:unnamed protein product [Vitrella brassicaformis CCMP3155]|uniref:Hexose transporter 1 n=2 Tax=Vitrella brassicaformis TaxID=1169539 RepID=A0A0G4EV00_VITBC|nr:unnamed protein product [Vitrella brassicaformis CCMP3155]|eukprot:CEM02280.1 unnamed protein product [Vitrella brassicaformis CCMP3155]
MQTSSVPLFNNEPNQGADPPPQPPSLPLTVPLALSQSAKKSLDRGRRGILRRKIVPDDVYQPLSGAADETEKGLAGESPPDAGTGMTPSCIKRSSNFFKSYSTRVVSVAVLGSFLFGYNLGVMNSCNSLIALTFRWCGNQWQSDCYKSNLYQTTVNSIVFLGAVFGAGCCGGLLAWGRRRSLQLACVCFIVGGVIGFFATGLIELCLSRVISGFGMGLVTVITPVYISEMSNPSGRGTYGAMHQVMISIGIFLSIAIGLNLSPNLENDPNYKLDAYNSHWWRVMLGVNAVPSAIALFLFTCWCNAETPPWLLTHDKMEQATEVVMRIYDAQDLEQVESEMIDMMRAAEEAKGLAEINMSSALYDGFYRYPLLVGFSMAALQQLSGINVITSTSNEMFAKSGLPSNWVTWVSSAMQFANVVMSIITTTFVDTLGRRPLLLLGLGIEWGSMLPVGILRLLAEQYNIHLLPYHWLAWLSVAATVLFVLGFSFSLGPVVWIYLSEIYPVEIRGTALGYCGVINWLSALILVFGSKFLSVTASMNIFAVVCLVGFLMTYRWVLETKGTSIDDSPLSPRSARSESSLVQRSVSSVSLDDLRNRLRSARSSPNLADPFTAEDDTVEMTEESSSPIGLRLPGDHPPLPHAASVPAHVNVRAQRSAGGNPQGH